MNVNTILAIGAIGAVLVTMLRSWWFSTTPEWRSRRPRLRSLARLLAVIWPDLVLLLRTVVELYTGRPLPRAPSVPPVQP